MKVVLAIIYNHRYDDNIPKLEKIYAGRFSTIFHLVPFYDGDLPNVIPVFEDSFYFQGYIPQAKHILQKNDCSHFVFAGDDLILHPKLNEDNILEELNIGVGNAFLPWSWGMLSDMSLEYANSIPSINSFYLDDLLLHHSPNWKNELPERDLAISIFEKYGFKTKKLSLKQLKGENGKYNYSRFKFVLRQFLKLVLKKRTTLPYPLLAAYSDFFIISKSRLDEFSSYCELFRRMRLWVEVAIPTAILLSHENVIFEKNTRWKGSTFWEKVWKGTNYDSKHNLGMKKLDLRLETSSKKIDKLNLIFEEDELYIHPIKLSKWT